MKAIKKYLYNSPTFGGYIHDKQVLVLDSSSTVFPLPSASLIVDGQKLERDDRVIFTNLTDSTKNNRIYKVKSHDSGLELKLVIPPGSSNGIPKAGLLVEILAGTYATEFVGWDGDSWDMLDLEDGSANNIGLGEGQIFKTKIGPNLQLKTIKAGANVTVTNNVDEILISAVGPDGGENNTASNVGGAVGLFKQKAGADLEFKTLEAGTNVTLDTTNPSKVIVNASGGGAGANTTLSNLTSPTSINQNLIPSGAGTRDVGSSPVPWSTGYYQSLQTDSIGKLGGGASVRFDSGYSIMGIPGQEVAQFDTNGMEIRPKPNGDPRSLIFNRLNFLYNVEIPNITANRLFKLPPNEGTVGQVLQTDGAGVTSWVTAGGGGANTTLSNLTSPIAINQSLGFSVDNTHDIGDAAKAAKDIWFKGFLRLLSGVTTVFDIQISGLTSVLRHLGGIGSNFNIESNGGFNFAATRKTSWSQSHGFELVNNNVDDITLRNASGGGNIVLNPNHAGGGAIRFVNNNTTPTVGHVWTATTTGGAGEFLPVPSGANTTLTNLGSTAINVNLNPDLISPTTPRDIGATFAFGRIRAHRFSPDVNTYTFTGDFTAGSSTITNVSPAVPDFFNQGSVVISAIGYTQRIPGTPSKGTIVSINSFTTNTITMSSVSLATGSGITFYGTNAFAARSDNQSGNLHSGGVFIRSGNAAAGDSGSVGYSSGNATSGRSGDVGLSTGNSTAGGHTGDINFLTGNANSSGNSGNINLGIGSIASGVKGKVNIGGIINLSVSSDPIAPLNGDIWYDGTNLKMYIGGVIKTVNFT